MRVVWLLGGDVQAKQQLEAALVAQSPLAEWQVRLATAISDIPDEDLHCTGNVIICDAFHPTFPAFAGVKAARAAGFKGPVFLAGEPSPELAKEPFKEQGLTGYFPSFDRADYPFIAGLIHHQLFFEGELEFAKFLSPGGRASMETIRSFRDFNAFGAKLATFVQKFNVDVNQVRKILMGMGLPHIKGTPTGPTVDQPFVLHYGIDPLKVMVGVSSFSRGASCESLRADFSEVLGGIKDQKALPGTIFPELFHVGRASQNLILVSGSAKVASPNLDPLFLVTALPFPQIGDIRQGPINLFSFLHAVPTNEVAKKAASPEPSAAAPVAMPVVDQKHEPALAVTSGPVPTVAPAVERVPTIEPVTSAAPAPTPPPVATEKAPEAVKGPAGVIPSQDVEHILSEAPNIVGDKPVMTKEASHSSSTLRVVAKPEVHEKPKAATSKGAPAHFDSPMTIAKLDAAEAEAKRLRDVCTAMGHDIRRLMKERRVPSTDRELRDFVTQLEEKIAKINQDRTRLNTVIAEKDTEIAALKKSLEEARTKAA